MLNMDWDNTKIIINLKSQGHIYRQGKHWALWVWKSFEHLSCCCDFKVVAAGISFEYLTPWLKGVFIFFRRNPWYIPISIFFRCPVNFFSQSQMDKDCPQELSWRHIEVYLTKTSTFNYTLLCNMLLKRSIRHPL